jgi:hypothetical protein
MFAAAAVRICVLLHCGMMLPLKCHPVASLEIVLATASLATA